MILKNEQSLPNGDLESFSTGLCEVRQTLILAMVQRAEKFIFCECVPRCHLAFLKSVLSSFLQEGLFDCLHLTSLFLLSLPTPPTLSVLTA